MSDTNRSDDTADDHGWFEQELVSQGQDVRSPSTAALDDETARQVVRDLLDASTVILRNTD